MPGSPVPTKRPVDLVSKRRQRRPSQEPFDVSIESLSHEGRGIAHVDGKAVFVDFALPGERVRARYTRTHRRFDEATTLTVLEPSAERVEPRCPHFGVCGGCSMQHLPAESQIRFKQDLLMEQLQRIGNVSPDEILPPLTGPAWGYRRKARLAVKNVPRKGRVLVGFREKYSPFVADMTECHVLDPRVGTALPAISGLIGSLDIADRIPQIEVAIGDDRVALVFRNLRDFTPGDREKLAAFGAARDFEIHEQPGNESTVAPIWPALSVPLAYALEESDVELRFRPTDFTQVNAEINRRMVPRALDLLALEPDDRVLDLFCGLGNFTLPLARRAGGVVGVEGSTDLVERAVENARRNGIDNAEFFVADLFKPVGDLPWAGRGFDKVLLDPPRSGAMEILPQVAAFAPRRIVYVSCGPATLARDAGLLVSQYGYRLSTAGVMDMFPHTAHVESIALFERAN